MSVLLEGRGLSKVYRLPRETLLAPAVTRVAVSEADIEVRAGETLAVIGESGSGKSSLVRLLLALGRPTTGTVSFDGRPVRATPSGAGLRWFRRETGIVLQDPYASLNPRLTVGRSIAEPLGALGVRGDHRALVAEVLGHVGLHDWRAEQYPHELSGGQRQRVALARAIVHRPRLLVGDEPMSALDVTVRAQILRLLLQLKDTLGLTIVLVSHDIGLVQHIADRIVVMKDGRIVESGPTADLLAHPAHPYTRTLLSSVPRLVERGTPA